MVEQMSLWSFGILATSAPGVEKARKPGSSESVSTLVLRNTGSLCAPGQTNSLHPRVVTSAPVYPRWNGEGWKRSGVNPPIGQRSMI